ncbi:Chromosome partition protein Smc [Candidatus Bilamarchaeum dharawalense]|uniref:Chromosome partition protein Smc n=1 Tax=Candidatus Bilamarchaeum dharawalense TaxID=2885759 RepID=A0A5E4LN46_9ARCH|nr:Chromosome partition protein Smc [Candidatus Bilamarchaeum dharawalense]
MEFDELLITTGVDALVRLVKEKQRIELETASSLLNIPQETLEEWARVLEEESILRMEFRLTKVYLIWVKPSEDEVATEKQSFYEEKKDVESQVDQFKQKISSETVELTELKRLFSEFYAKMYTKVEELEKKVAPVPAAKTLSEDALVKYTNELTGLETKLTDIKLALTDVKNEINSVGVGRDDSPSQELVKKIEGNSSEIKEIQQSIEELKKKAMQQEGQNEVSLPTVKDIKKKFETFQRDFTSLRSKNAQIREDMLSLHESSEILKSVAESIMGQEDKINALRKDAQQVSQDIEKMVEKTTQLSREAKQNVDLMDRLGTSVDVAKNVLNKFPSQESVIATLDKLKADEDALAEKNDSLAKIIEAVGGKQVTAKQLTELVQKLDEKLEQAKQDVEGLNSTLNEEKGTYLTFQKIKERIVPSIEGYQTQLDTMEQRIVKIRDETRDQIKNIKTETQKLETSLQDGGEMGEMVKVAQEIKEKKKVLDEIKQTFDSLTEISDNLNKRATLLSREAKLLEIRSGSAPLATEVVSGKTETPEQKEKSVRQQLELSEEEELEFRRKREELKKLIQKLWEE